MCAHRASPLCAMPQAAKAKSAQAQRVIGAVLREVGRWSENAEAQDQRHREVRVCVSFMAGASSCP